MFYTFHQNNSGGEFKVDEDTKHYTIIEANNAEEANQIAINKTDIYFDGVERGWDCPCCGDRWCKVDDLDGTDKPTIYGKDVFEYKFSMGFREEFIVHYADGRKVVGKCYKE